MATLREQIKTTALTLTRFRELMKRMQENRPQDDLSLIKKAYDYSLKHHEGQTRASGEPYDLAAVAETIKTVSEELHKLSEEVADFLKKKK